MFASYSKHLGSKVVITAREAIKGKREDDYSCKSILHRERQHLALSNGDVREKRGKITEGSNWLDVFSPSGGNRETDSFT